MSMDELLLATNNPHKIMELRRLLADVPCELLSPSDLGLRLDVIENGETYVDNATIKARAFAQASGRLSIADDSGIEVDALNGRPGIRSARYGSPALSDDDRVELLLSELQNVEDPSRGCHYVAALVLSWPPEEGNEWGRHEVFEGTCAGFIARVPIGCNGFGYDPIFALPQFGATMAQIDPRVKDSISHRGSAVRKAAVFLRNHINGSDNL
jgi:XTP/dITP diphosphohydrolase